MKRSRRWLMAAAAFVLGGSLAALSLAGPKVEEPGLTVELAIPVCTMRGELPDARTIQFGGRDFYNEFKEGSHFHAVVTNVSGIPLRVWRKWCGWGYDNLKLEMVGSDGEVIPLFQKGKMWTYDAPDYSPVESGEHYVVDICFAPKQWQKPHLELVKPAADGTIGLRAVYEIEADAETEKFGVWTGRVVSQELRVLVADLSEKEK